MWVLHITDVTKTAGQQAATIRTNKEDTDTRSRQVDDA
jgi:hypothetical protein